MADVLLVVGAGPGLGASVARRFLAEGFAVAVASRAREKIDAVAAAIPGARGYAADATDEA
ncbi:MAG: SDR family NAD(P)-dependent oxidoreductase, partial [Alphaproteobacteria bacterium]